VRARRRRGSGRPGCHGSVAAARGVVGGGGGSRRCYSAATAAAASGCRRSGAAAEALPELRMSERKPLQRRKPRPRPGAAGPRAAFLPAALGDKAGSSVLGRYSPAAADRQAACVRGAAVWLGSDVSRAQAAPGPGSGV
jgi:hypothetical protein